MATKEERSSFLLHTPSTSCTINCESRCRHVGADSLEMDTRKEREGQGQGSAESKLSLISHSSSSHSLASLYYGLSSQIVVLGQNFFNCTGTLTIVLENQCGWKKA